MTATRSLDPITAGDTQSYDLTFDDDSGSAIDISGWELWFTVKEDRGDADSDALIQETVTTHDDPTNGKTSVTLSSSQTADILGTHYFDIQVKRSDGSIKTVIEGTIPFEKGVTEAT